MPTSFQVLIRRLALGLTLPVISYTALTVLTFAENADSVALVGGAWCASVWAGHRAALWLRATGRPRERTETASARTRQARAAG